jgi:transposase-like protein
MEPSTKEDVVPKTRRKRTLYSDQKRSAVLEAAQKEGLTATEVEKRFGVTPVTYYSWRRKYGVGGRRGSTTTRANGGGSLEAQVRSEVQAKVRQILPTIVRSEVSSYLDTVFRARGRARKA